MGAQLLLIIRIGLVFTLTDPKLDSLTALATQSAEAGAPR